jgi:adenylosuccinate lyase
MNNIFSGLVVYEAVIKKHIDEELPFMATENIIMACVALGLSRQDAHEEIRVLSHEAGAQVKQKGLQNDLKERIKKTKFFEPVVGQLEELFEPSTFIGRAPQQVTSFIEKEVEPALEKYQAAIAKGEMAELSV